MSPDQSSTHLTSMTTLAPAINAWKIFLADQGNSPHTVKAFVHDLELVAAYLTPGRTVGSIITSDLTNFLDWLQKGRGVPCSPKTLSRRITSLKAFFRWLRKNGVLLIDPAEKVLQQSVISPLPQVLTPEEVDQIMQVCDKFRHSTKPDSRYYVLFYLLILTGIKKNECLSLHLNHIDESTPDKPFLFIRYANPQNRYKERKISIQMDWLTSFREYQSQYGITGPMFPWSQRRLEYLLEDLGKETGLEKHISFDMCRWTCALLDWKNGDEKDKIRQKFGLSKVQWREISMKLDQLAAK